MSPQPDLLSTHQTARLCHVSLRQLQWWDEQRVISPTRIGHRRWYTAEQIGTIQRIRDLRKAGIGLKQVKKYLQWQYSNVVKLQVPGVINGTLVVPKL